MQEDSPKKDLILSIIAQNENQALESNSLALGRSFQGRFGFRFQLVDMFKPSGSDELLAALRSGQVAFAYALAGVGSRLELNSGVNIWTASRTPFVSLWYDNPSYNYRQHIVDSAYIVQGYHVRDHLDMRERYLPKSQSSVAYLPMRFQVAPDARHIPFGKRLNRIIFVKTGKNPATIAADWERHSLAVRTILKDLSALALNNRHFDLPGAVFELFDQYKLDRSNLDLAMGITQQVDDYVRAWRSDRLARALLKFPADIVGRGWDYLDATGAEAAIIPPVPFDHFMKKITENKIVANSNPLWRDGLHERAAHAIRYGNLLVTDRTERSDYLFNGLSNYQGFEWSDDLSDVISQSFALADADIDYLPGAEAALLERAWMREPDYLDQILKCVERVRITTET